MRQCASQYNKRQGNDSSFVILLPLRDSFLCSVQSQQRLGTLGKADIYVIPCTRDGPEQRMDRSAAICPKT